MNIFSRIHQYLISNHPVIWNTKVIYVLPVAAIIHVCFYLYGRFSAADLSTLKTYSAPNRPIGFSIFVSSLFLVVWLTFYLRNNAVKSWFPISKKYLIIEYLLVIVVFFSTVSFYESWSFGDFNKYKDISQSTDITKEVNQVNLAHHFLAFAPRLFGKYHSCDSSIKDVDINEHILSIDDENTKSYLHYCGIAYRPDKIKNINDPYTFNSVANQYLLNGDKEAVKNTLQLYLKLCDKYSVEYNLDLEKYVTQIFSTPNFEIIPIEELESFSEDMIVVESITSEYMVNDDSFSWIFDRLSRYRENYWFGEHIYQWINFSLMLSILLMSFRLTRLKEWFISLISGCIALIFINIISNPFENSLPYLITIAGIIVLVVSTVLIFLKKRKVISIVLLNWFTWSYPFYFFMLDSLYNSHLSWRTRSHFVISCLVIFLPMIFIVIPLAHKWQANPEE